jgi:hypothetical protein
LSCICTGYYTFSWDAEGPGTRAVKAARYSFVYRRDANARTGWSIVDHHSSAMPNAPTALRRASN